MKFTGICLLAVWMGLMVFMTSMGEAAAVNGFKLSNVSSQKQNKEKMAQEWFNQGLEYQKRSLYEKAIQAYTKALELGDQSGDTYYNRGCAYAEMRKYDAALADFNKAIELVPQDVEVYYNRGIVYDAKELYEQALADYNKVIELNTKYANAYYSKAIDLENLGRYAEAKGAYEDFIQYAPANDPDLLFAKERLQILSEE